LKEPCAAIVGFVAEHSEDFLTDAEVLQEIIHVYRARRDWAVGRTAFRRFASVVAGHVSSILPADALRAAELADRHEELDARDLIHLAVMNRLGVTRIITAAAGFDGIPGIERLDPARFAEWRDGVLEDA
jgi:predicted nucleic acid-binding protein